MRLMPAAPVLPLVPLRRICTQGSPKTHYTVRTLGGRLTVEFTPENNGEYTHVYLTGPARKVFKGRIELNDLKLKSK